MARVGACTTAVQVLIRCFRGVDTVEIKSLPSDTVADGRIGEGWTSMRGIIELASRRVPKPAKPILDRFPDHRRIPDRPDAGDWIRRSQVAAERGPADCHGEQPIVIANRSRTAEQIDVKAVHPATRSHVDA